ncbi:hypothetical protein [Pseudodesulfovibrio senegalensis]|uniref:ScoMcrA-like N-terminal head domain-containing protein n=1 Tax=Pseudodesulfovibrio senegalensis TaxID=1721087 RepID=A0A6N6MXY4_9BACT|nr:hypothetical protein [Pseudodesulfovibrio senegalensis]KAB1440264.1 hypothetical protein F8A88_13510 [Pseudodesulfovibrio senegalensis]
MSLRDLTDSKAVEKAIEEYDKIGRKEFLKKYGFGKTKEYFLIYKNKRYDSKAIVGAAYKYQFPHKPLLTWKEFSGGKTGAAKRLRDLGFNCPFPSK